MSNPGVMKGTPIPVRDLFKEFFILLRWSQPVAMFHPGNDFHPLSSFPFRLGAFS